MNQELITILLAIGPLALAWYQFFYRRGSEKLGLDSSATQAQSVAIKSLSDSITEIDVLRGEMLRDLHLELSKVGAQLAQEKQARRLETGEAANRIALLSIKVNELENTNASLNEKLVVCQSDLVQVRESLNECNRQLNIYRMRLDKLRADKDDHD